MTRATLPLKTDEELAVLRTTALSYRTARARIKASLTAGDVTLDALLAAGHRAVGDPILGRIRIGQLLNAVPLWGAVRVDRLLEQLGVDPKTHVDVLSQAKCDAILEAVASGPQRHG